MKKSVLLLFTFFVIALAQVSCFGGGVNAILCELKGGSWIEDETWRRNHCQEVAPTPIIPKIKETDTSTNTPAVLASSACDAYSYISIETKITEQAQYDTWNSCQYNLSVKNTLPDKEIWIWIHHIHATESGIDRDEWDSSTIESGEIKEWSFSSIINNDNTFGHSYASEIAVILAKPECKEMHSRDIAITMAKPLEWQCEP